MAGHATSNGYSSSTDGYGNTGANSDGSSFGGATNSATGQSVGVSSASTSSSQGHYDNSAQNSNNNSNKGQAFQDNYSIGKDANGKYSIATDANGKHSIQSAAKKSEQNNNNSTAETVSVGNMDAKAANKANKGLLTISERKTNIKGVDENGKTLNGKVGDRNGDGKISFGEAIANHFSNLAARANSFFGGGDENGLTASGRQADKNGDGKVSFGERIGNMFNNLGTNINQAFGGVNYQGRTKSGEQVVNPGEHVTFGQRMSNIGHNIASKNGAYWSDTNNNGVMDSDEVAGAAIQRGAFGIIGMIPGVGTLASNTLSGLASGAQGGKGNSLAAQLGRSLAEAGKNNNGKNSNGKTNNTAVATTTGSIPTVIPETVALSDTTNTKQDNAVKNFMKKTKQIKLNSPAVSSVYISRKKDENRAITASDEELKEFAIRSLNSNRYNPYWL